MWLKLQFYSALFLFFASSAVANRFGFENVVDEAAKLAGKPYQAPAAVPKSVRDLDFDQYQSIRFKPEKSLWHDSKSLFRVMLVSPGHLYTHTVKINVVDESGVKTVPYSKDDFVYPSKEVANRIPSDLGYAGFKLTYPFKSRDLYSQFLVLVGASYFRAIGKHNVFGLSGRGIAVDTGLPSGEQFPSFVEYWLVRPAPDATTMTFYARLNGESLTGAYRFEVTPGVETTLNVKAVLFPRKGIKLLGIAPLTSMFFYGANTPRPADEWRPQVHGSDGLLINNGRTGEWLWRPLINPEKLREEYFETENVRGFGLLQRQTHFYDYQDLATLYGRRPSAWVIPRGDWGKGHVVLVQLPSATETEDNMVAFWSSETPVTGGGRLDYDYTLVVGEPGVPRETMAYAIDTFVGSGDVIGGGNVKGAYRVIVDFEGGPLSKLSEDTQIQGVVTAVDHAEIINQSVEYVEPTRRWRLSILARPAEGKPLSLRAFLRKGGRTLTETWTYSLPWKNKIRRGE